MSTSLLYHAFGIRGYRCLRTDYCEGEVVYTIEQGRHTLQCPLCGSRAVTAHGPQPAIARLRAGTATAAASGPGSAQARRTCAMARASCPGEPSGEPSSWASRASTASTVV